MRVLPRGWTGVPDLVTSEAVTVAPGRLTLARPRIAGRPVVGRRLVVRTVATPGARLRVRWYADGRVVRGATTRSLRLTGRMRGHRISVRVTASRAAHTTVRRASAPTRPVRSTSRKG